MRKTAKLLYLVSLGVLAAYLAAAALFRLHFSTDPLAFEGFALAVFLPLAGALWLDYRGRPARPIWLFWLGAAVSLLGAVHLYLFIRLLVG